MSITKDHIVYENEAKNTFVTRVRDGFRVFRNVVTHAEQIGIIAWQGQRGFDKAKEICDR